MKNLNILLTITNTISVICWTILAIVFKHWWIALFGLLFLSYPTLVHKYYRVCDKCGATSPYAETQEEAIKLAEKHGWKHYKTTNEDFCPKCIRNMTND